MLAGIGVEVVAKTAAPEEALAAAREHKPDLLVGEMEVAQADGFAFVREAREHNDGLQVIVLSRHDSSGEIEAAFAAGAAAYIVKTAEPADIAFAIRQAFKHSVFLATGTNGASASQPEETPAGSTHLTRRELEILRLAARAIRTASSRASSG